MVGMPSVPPLGCLNLIRSTNNLGGIKMRKLALLFSIALVLSYTATNVQAQSAGSVRGTVVDPQGASVPDAKVSLTNVATGIKQEAVTNDAGLFVFAYVAPATYEVAVQKDGFRTSSTKTAVE